MNKSMSDYAHYTKDWIPLAARPDNLQQNLNCTPLRWLDGVFQGPYLLSLPTSPLTKIWKNYHHSCFRCRWKFVMIRVAILSSCHSNEMTPLLIALAAVRIAMQGNQIPLSCDRLKVKAIPMIFSQDVFKVKETTMRKIAFQKRFVF